MEKSSKLIILDSTKNVHIFFWKVKIVRKVIQEIVRTTQSRDGHAAWDGSQSSKSRDCPYDFCPRPKSPKNSNSQETGT